MRLSIPVCFILLCLGVAVSGESDACANEVEAATLNVTNIIIDELASALAFLESLATENEVVEDGKEYTITARGEDIRAALSLASFAANYTSLPLFAKSSADAAVDPAELPPETEGEGERLVGGANTRVKVVLRSTPRRVYLGTDDTGGYWMMPKRDMRRNEEWEIENWNRWSTYDVLCYIREIGHHKYDNNPIKIDVGNPGIGWPWARVNGVSRNFGQGQTEVFEGEGYRIRVTRHNDAPGGRAKVWLVEVLQ